MKQVKIITDSASDLPLQLAKELGIEVVPLIVRFNHEEYLDGKQITASEFYEKMAEHKELPQTSAPSPGDFEAVFNAGSDAEILCVNVSSELSATISSAEIAAKNFEGDVHIFDSLSVSVGELLYVLEAAKMAQAGADIQSILNELTQLQKNSLHCYGIIDTLENLRKGGRIGPARAFLGSALNLKPIISIRTGKIEIEDKVRTRKKSLEWVRDKVASLKNPRAIAVGHGNATDFDVLLEMLKEVTEIDKVTLIQIGPVVGTHSGAGGIGLAYFL